MFKILQKAVTAGISTVAYPDVPAVVSAQFRGAPEFDFVIWRDARPAADLCPTGAIQVGQADPEGTPPANRRVTVDYGRCVFCGQCAELSPDGAVRVTTDFELATHNRARLIRAADYSLNPDGTHHQFIAEYEAEVTVEEAGAKLGDTIHDILGRSLAIRQVDAGSCNGCELEIVALNNPIHDIERFGIHFVASPRHADMLLVTGPVTRNMELALRKTYAATPDPKVVVAVGACGISGGIFGTNYASLGGVDATIPVDVYIPGCPPRPEALIYGILLAVGRLAGKS
jgi:Ni,Fe-hydrogenase III small subunit/formate hydrogenlyase subunit 6/NADH:ubiquinone oxidoreductase subunit I